MGTFEAVLSGVAIVAIALVIGRLVQTRFLPVCRWFAAYLAILCVELLLLKLVPVRTNGYGNIYFSFQSVNLFVACGVVREIYQLALRDRVGLAKFGRAVMRWAVVVAVGIAGISLILDSKLRPGQSVIVHRYFTIERVGNSVLLFLLLIMAIYLAWFPVKLRRNILIYSFGFAVFFGARAAGLLVTNLLPQTWLRTVSNGMLVGEALCLGFWIFGFRRDRDDDITTTGHRWNPGEYERLTEQLDSINEVLERYSQK